MAGGEMFYINQIKNWKPSKGSGGCWPVVLVIVAAAIMGGVLIYLAQKAG